MRTKFEHQECFKLTGAGGAGVELACPIVAFEICLWYLDLYLERRAMYFQFYVGDIACVHRGMRRFLLPVLCSFSKCSSFDVLFGINPNVSASCALASVVATNENYSAMRIRTVRAKQRIPCVNQVEKEADLQESELLGHNDHTL